MLELDHVFCMVRDPAHPVQQLEDDGWTLDPGQAHRGQGTRNRRLAWRERFFELLWVTDVAEARANPLRLDRRAEWTSTGASPFGFAFRGQIEPARADEYWLYDALGVPIWVHRDHERCPERPLVFVLASDVVKARRQRPRTAPAVAHRQPGELQAVRVRGPSAPALLPYAGPPIIYREGPHLLELVVGNAGSVRQITDALRMRS